jgi:mono/diheme cytochrome c family protein
LVAVVALGAQIDRTTHLRTSVNDGVYTAAQAQRGAGLFDDHCGSCHEPDRFAGRLFVTTWTGPLDALFATVRKSMPEDNPGGLAPQVYADVIAYWLRLNGYPAGAERLEGTTKRWGSAARGPAAAKDQ